MLPVSLVSQPSRLAISGLVLARRSLVGLAIGVDGAGQVAVADAGRRDVAPGRVGERVLGQLEQRLPGLDRRRLVVEAVVDLAQAEQRGPGERRVVEPDDAREIPPRLGEVA